MYITTEGVKSERAAEDSSRITIQATGAISWRRNDIKYRKNEAFIDVIESVNLLMSNTGTILRADVAGQILMRAYLSGTPECKFGLNDKLLLDKDVVQRTT
jgi:AP-2 complex subunit mu-1